MVVEVGFGAGSVVGLVVAGFGVGGVFTGWTGFSLWVAQ